MATIPRSVIVAGDTSDVWEIGLVTSRAGSRPITLAPLDGFTCSIAVAGANPPINRQVTETNAAGTRFRAWLTPAETLALGAGPFTVGLELRNPSLDPPLVAEAQGQVTIVPGAVPPA